jgi:hypothetical protein
MYEELYKKIDDNSSDLVTCSYTSLKNGKLASRAYPQMDPEVATQFILQSAIGIASKSDPMRKFNLSGQIWNKLFRYDIIKSMQIRFPDTNQSAYEDLTFLIKYISYIKKTEIIPSDLYYHIIGITNFGATYQYSSPKKILYFLEHMNSFLKKKNIFQENKCRFYNSVQFLIFRSILLNFSFKTGNIFYGLNSISIYGKNKIVTDSFKKHRYLIFTSPSMQNNILVKLFYYISKCYYSHY